MHTMRWNCGHWQVGHYITTSTGYAEWMAQADMTDPMDAAMLVNFLNGGGVSIGVVSPTVRRCMIKQ